MNSLKRILAPALAASLAAQPFGQLKGQSAEARNISELCLLTSDLDVLASQALALEAGECGNNASRVRNAEQTIEVLPQPDTSTHLAHRKMWRWGSNLVRAFGNGAESEHFTDLRDQKRPSITKSNAASSPEEPKVEIDTSSEAMKLRERLSAAMIESKSIFGEIRGSAYLMTEYCLVTRDNVAPPMGLMISGRRPITAGIVATYEQALINIKKKNSFPYESSVEAAAVKVPSRSPQIPVKKARVKPASVDPEIRETMKLVILVTSLIREIRNGLNDRTVKDLAQLIKLRLDALRGSFIAFRRDFRGPFDRFGFSNPFETISLECAHFEIPGHINQSDCRTLLPSLIRILNQLNYKTRPYDMDHVRRVLETLVHDHPKEEWTAAQVKEQGGLLQSVDRTRKDLILLEERGIATSRGVGAARKFTLAEAVRPPDKDRLVISSETPDLLVDLFGSTAAAKEAAGHYEEDEFRVLVVDELMGAYRYLQMRAAETTPSDSLARTASSVVWVSLDEVRSHGSGLFRSDEEAERALTSLDREGFVIRHHGPLWNTSGLGFLCPDAVRIARERERWTELLDNEDPSAIAERILMLLDAAGFGPRAVGNNLYQRLDNWKNGDHKPVGDKLDQALEEFADALGVEPILLRTGRSRAELERHIPFTLPSTEGKRAAVLRRIEGLSRRTVAEEMGIDLEMLQEFESGGHAGFEHPSRWRDLAKALRRDAFLILLGVPRAVAFQGPLTRELVKAIQLASGLLMERMAKKVGISRPTLLGRKNGKPLSMTAEALWNAATAEEKVNESLRPLEWRPLAESRPAAWALLVRIVQTVSLYELAARGELRVADLSGGDFNEKFRVTRLVKTLGELHYLRPIIEPHRRAYGFDPERADVIHDLRRTA